MDARNELKLPPSGCRLASAATRPHPSSHGGRAAHRQKRKRPEQSLAFKWGWNVATTTATSKTPTAFRPWGEINSSGLSCLVGVDLRATGFVLVQVELLEQLALPNQQVGQPAFMLE